LVSDYPFFSAVADRFGWWGAFGQPGVAWGDFARFVAYTAKLNWFLPEIMIQPLAVVVTCLEIVLGLLPWPDGNRGSRSGQRNSSCGIGMALALRMKAPLDFLVFSAAGGSLLPAACPALPYSVDELQRRRGTQ